MALLGLRKGSLVERERGTRALMPTIRAMGVLAAAHTAAHPVRTMLTLVGVCLGVGAPVAIDLANRDVLRSFQQSVVQVAGSATLEVTGGEAGFKEDAIRLVRDHPDVLAALPVVQRSVRDEASGEVLTLIGTDLLEAALVKGIRWRETEDEGARPLLRDDALWIGGRLAALWGGQAGGSRRFELGMAVRSLRIGGVVEAGSGVGSVWDTMALTDIATAQEWFECVGSLDRIDIVTRAEADIGEVRLALQGRLPGGLTVRRPAQRGEQVEAMVAAFRLNLLMLSAVGLLVGGFLIYNTLSFSVAQRRRDIGILRAIGLSEQGVYALFLCEGLMYGAIGGALGSLAGVVLAQSLVGVVGRNISELYVAVARLPGHWPTWRQVGPILLEGVGLGVVLSMLGAFTPSRDAARTDVVGALAPGGYELATIPNLGRWLWSGVGLLAAAAGFARLPPQGDLPVFGYLSVLCLLLGLTAVAPAVVGRLDAGRKWWISRRRDRNAAASLAGIAASAAGRTPHRNGVMISSLLVGLAITVGVVVMIRSFRQTVEVWIDQTVVADLIVTPAGWPYTGQESKLGGVLPRSWADRIAALPGVAAVDTYRNLSMELGGRPRTIVARDLGLHAERSRYLFLRGESAEVLRRAVRGRGVVVSEVLAGAMGLSVGDEVVLATPAGSQAFPVMGIFLDYATDGGKVVMDRALFLEYWGDEDANVIPVYVAPGADPHEVGRRIHALLPGAEGGPARFSVLPNADLRREILEIFDRTFRVTYVLEAITVVIAIFGIVNTLLTASLERRRELATLQALGAGRGQIVGLLLWEAGYLGAIGGLLGAAGGICLAAVLVWVINKQSFGWTIALTVPFEVPLGAVLAAVVIAVAAAFWPARWIARQPLVEGLRYE